MYIKDDVAYAGEPEPLLKVIGVKAVDDYRLWLRFSNHEERLFDMMPLLAYPAFNKLQDPDCFKDVYLDYGVPTWSEGTIDVAPETLYAQSVQVMQSAG